MSGIHKAWKTAVLGAVIASSLAGGSAFAFTYPNLKHMKYEYFQNDFYSSSFGIAWEAMASLYKGTRYEKDKKGPPDNPLIGIGEFDLNGDKIPEIISFPTEEEGEIGNYCTKDSVCPTFITEIRDGKIHSLGKIFASSVDRGDNITNGYWELKAYTHDWTEPSTDEHDVYVYNKLADGYIKAEKKP